ncbi:MurR/RpiR family transcriptional regulator [Occultella glacieicola]|uniref:MurR/RpiR family transcriptional regulator n=1 Tax=Occultella glacieicola TaxID=2518684 RepID=A0ABY2DY23_9MICO|nr:MurR/RpiR family transcriptional regulator [Occultella glacieicola]TDE89199.1 MurR/RpiR family transcriptional regulator [Occultella glacieicola]
MSIQSQIQAKRDTLAPSMRRVADAILADPRLVLEETISELARKCSTSETTIVRFCRTLGLAGYVQLRIALATEVGREGARRGPVAAYGSDISAGSTLEEVVASIGFTENLCIEETINNLDVAELGRVVDAIDSAARISVYGVSGSGWSAADLHRKLFRIGRVAYSFPDGHDAVTSLGLMGAGDVAVGFSHRGTTAEVVRFLESARERGVTAVAITNVAGSPVARAADLVLRTTVRESPLRSGSMASRTAQLLIVDCIFVAVAQRRMAETVDALRDTHDAVALFRDN